jgi:hypothetical protein
LRRGSWLFAFAYLQGLAKCDPDLARLPDRTDKRRRHLAQFERIGDAQQQSATAFEHIGCASYNGRMVLLFIRELAMAITADNETIIVECLSAKMMALQTAWIVLAAQ